MNAPASTSTGVDPTKGTQENPYTWEEYEELRNLGLWTQGWFVEGHGILLPDVIVSSCYPSQTLEDEDDVWDNWDNDGINPHPNPSPDETGGNGGNYPPGGGGGGGGNSTGGGNGNNGGNNGNGQNNGEGRKHYEYSLSNIKNIDILDLEDKIIKSEIEGDCDYFIVGNERYKCNETFELFFVKIAYRDNRYSYFDRNKVMVIKGVTWKLYKLLVQNYGYEEEWQAIYKGGATPKDNTNCIIRTIFVEGRMCGNPIEGFDSMVHSHPDSNTGADDADKYAAYLYEKEGYTFFGIVNPYSLVPNDFKPMSYGEAIRYNLEAIQS